MHIGRQLIAGSSDPKSVFTEWMGRGGDSAVFTVELINVITASFTVEVFHKNSEETGPGTLADDIVTGTTTTGLHKATIGNLLEMVRYKITVEGDGATGSVLYRIHQPTWFDTARVP